MANLTYPLGIDFGTSYLRAAFPNATGEIEVIWDNQKNEYSALLPASLHRDGDGVFQAGWPSDRQRERLILKRDISYPGDERSDQEPGLASLMILAQRLKSVLEARSPGLALQGACSFNPHLAEAVRSAWAFALQESGFNDLRWIPENEAALMAYARLHQKNGLVALIDFGGGYLTTTIAELHDPMIQIRSAVAVPLGGEDLDRKIALALSEEISEAWNEDLRKDIPAMRRLLDEAKYMKAALTHRGSVDFNFEHAGRVFSRAISRFEIINFIRDILDALEEPCRTALKRSGVMVEEIDEILLAGGSSRIPYFQEMLKKVFIKKPQADLNVDQAVVLGTALAAQRLFS